VPQTDANALNWATESGAPLSIDLDGAGGWTAPTAVVDPGAALPDPTPIPITFRGAQLAVAGSVTGLDLFGILTGGADFSVTTQLVDIDLDGLTSTPDDRLNDARLLTFALSNLNLSLGTGGAGLTIGPGGTVGIATISAPTPATDNRTWTAVVGKDLAVSLNLPGITATVTGGTLKINRASGALNGTAATALNWASTTGAPLTVDLNAADGWTTPTALVDPGKALPTPVLMPVTLRGSQLAVAGTLSNLNIFDFVTGSANFALTSQTVDVDLDGDGNASTGEQLNDATLMTFALDELNLTLGADGVGLAVTSGALGIAILSAPAPATGTDNRSWVGLSAQNLGITLTIPASAPASSTGRCCSTARRAPRSPAASRPPPPR
jgi:hypothetical protein